MKIVFTILGFMCLIIGLIGVVLPILPTTPFLLLAGFLFTKSSKKLDNWFINTKVYNNHLKDFAENKEMKRNHKWTLLIIVDLMMIVYFFAVSLVVLKVLIVFLEIIKYYYFTFHIKTI